MEEKPSELSEAWRDCAKPILHQRLAEVRFRTEPVTSPCPKPSASALDVPWGTRDIRRDEDRRKQRESATGLAVGYCAPPSLWQHAASVCRCSAGCFATSSGTCRSWPKMRAGELALLYEDALKARCWRPLWQAPELQIQPHLAQAPSSRAPKGHKADA